MKPKKNKNKVMRKSKSRKNIGGRKKKYNPETFPLLAKGFARDGFIDREIAYNLGIAVGTLYDYKNKYPEFSNALKEGKSPINIKIEDAIINRALGLNPDAEETVTVYNVGEDGNPIVRELRTTKKKILPDSILLMFLAKNRMPEKYREKSHIEHSAQSGVLVVPGILGEDEWEKEVVAHKQRMAKKIDKIVQ